MKTDKDHIKEIFSSKLQGFEADLPPSLWEKIEADLPVAPSIKPKVKKPVYRILTWVAAAAAVILAVLYFVPQEDKNTQIARLIESNNTSRKSHSLAQLKWGDDNVVDKTVKPEKVKPVIDLLVSSSGRLVSNARMRSAIKVLPQNTLPENIFAVVDTVTKEKPQDVQREYIADANKQEDFQPKDENFERDLKTKIAAFESAGDNSANMLADNNTSVTLTKNSSRSKGFTMGVGGGGGLAKSDDVTNAMRYANSKLMADGFSMVRSQQFKLQHNQPVSFGLAVSKKITDRISIESGIVYTYVSAKIKLNGNSGYNQNNEQYFHYFGIPLSVNYKFAQWKKAQFYTSLGGMIQKDFSGRITSESSIDDLKNSDRSSERSISQKNPQFSATGLVGIEYPLYKKLSAYTTFGGAYYFDANNEYETIYSDRKWLFNFNLGLKFGF